MSLKKTSSQTSINKTIGGAVASTPNIYLIAPNSVNQYANGSLITAGGPSVVVSNVVVTNSTYGVIDDTAISTAGGYVKITGSGFTSGCVAYMDGETSVSTTFISSTEIRAQFGAITSGNTHVYVINPDNSVGIKLNAIVASGVPAWTTESPLSSQPLDIAFQLQLSANSDSNVSYYVSAGNSLPSGTTLASNGYFSGTVTGSADTTYSFSVDAIDAENQETPKTFSITFLLGDAYFYLTSLLLSAEANNWTTDISNNNHSPVVFGDTKPSAFSPYNTSWGTYFDGSGDYLTVVGSSNLAFGSNDWTIECWAYFYSVSATQKLYDARPLNTIGGSYPMIYMHTDGKLYYYTDGATKITGNSALSTLRWYHIVVSRVSGTTRMFIDGTQQTQTYTDSTVYINGTNRPLIGIDSYDASSFPMNGYISNMRVLNGTGYTSVTVPTATLTAITNTHLLTCHNNRFVDSSNNNYTITPAGNVSVKSFGPFAETDNTTGSAFFDGTGDYVEYANTTINAFGTSQYSVEFWFYGDASAASYRGVFGGTGFMIFTNGNEVQVWNGANPIMRSYGAPLLKINQWNFVQVIRSNTSLGGLSISINGVTATGNDGENYAGAVARIANDGVPRYTTGYLADLRVSDTARTVGVPSSPLTSDANTKLHTLKYRKDNTNSRFIDSSGLKNSVTRFGNATLNTFNHLSPAGWSQLGDGTGDATYWSKSLSLAGDWCLELWFFHSGYTGAARGLFCLGATANYGMIQVSCDENAGTLLYEEAALHFHVSYNGGTWNDRWSVSNAYTKNVWNHLVMTRQSGYIRSFINGKLLHTARALTGGTQTGSTHRFSTQNNGSTFFPGFISNFRLQNGNIPTDYQTSSNTANAQIFTSTTTALTANSTTDLLLFQNSRFIDNSPTPATLSTVAGDAKIVNLNPFKPTGIGYSSNTYGGSVHLDGTGDYLTVADNSEIEFNAGDFCIEAVFYSNSISGSGVIVDKRSGVYGPILLWRNAANIICYMSSTNSSWDLVATVTIGAITVGQWYHVAVYKVGDVVYGSINGTISTLKASGASSLTPYNNTTNWFFGAGNNAADLFNGFIAGARVIIGPHSYTSTSAPIPTTPFTSTPYTKILLVNDHAGLVDWTTKTSIETINTYISPAADKFGYNSIYFNGSSAYLKLTSLLLGTGTSVLPVRGDFTVECWFNPASLSGDRTLFYLNAGTTSYAAVKVDVIATSGVLRLQSSTSGSAWAINSTSTAPSAVVVGTWYHIAVVRNGSSMTLYLNGSAIVTSTSITNTTALMAGTINFIGAHQNTTVGQYTSGYVDDLRISLFARYTSGFTAPTAPFVTR